MYDILVRGDSYKMHETADSTIQRAIEVISHAETVIIGAGAGLSTSAGMIYSGTRFQNVFGDFIAKYGFTDMYSGGFYPFKTLEEHWAYWSRYIFINRYMDAPKNDVYKNLLKLVSAKDYFVLTTNVDHLFQRSGFDKTRLFYTQGDYGLFQCSVPCHKTTYDNELFIKKMMEDQKDMRIPSVLVPHCPKCGEPMSMNLRSDETFVEDDGWKHAYSRWNDYLDSHKNSKTVFLELGVGLNTPSIIKYNFQRMVLNWKDAFYICINKGEAECPNEIAGKALCIDGDIGEILIRLLNK